MRRPVTKIELQLAALCCLSSGGDAVVRRAASSVRRSTCSVQRARQGNQGRRATASVNVLHAGQSADISPFISLRRSPNALGRPKRCRGRWIERPAGRAGGVAPCRAGVSRAGREGRAGGCPARNDTERGTPARRGAVATPMNRRFQNYRRMTAQSRPQTSQTRPDPQVRLLPAPRRTGELNRSGGRATRVPDTAPHACLHF